MTRIYVDTNIFLHAKPLREIPWEIYETPPIQIIVTKTNLRELDRHKDQHPKKHMRERALRALKQIEESLRAPQLRPAVRLVVDDRAAKLELEQFDLDPAHADDTIIAGALASIREYPGEKTVLYSHDVWPRITAARVGLSARELPDAVRFPPTKDDAERENERLKREIHELRTAAPILSLLLHDEESRVIVPTHAPVPTILSDEDIAIQVATASQEFVAVDPAVVPEEEENVRRSPNGRRVLVIDFDAPKPDPASVPRSEYLRYERERSAYAPAYEAYLRARYAAVSTRSRTVTLDFALCNKGGQPAEDIDVTITVPVNWSISTSDIPLPAAPLKPTPPQTRGELPQPNLVELISPFSSSDMLSRIPDINPFKTGPTIDGQDVTWWVRNLKHGFTARLGAFNVTAREKLVPCKLSYSLHAGNAVKSFEGSILVTPEPPTAPER